MSVKKDSVFTIIEKEITLPNMQTPIFIQPFGDLHRFAPNCAVDKWKNFREWAKKQHTPYTYYISMGDLDDLASTSERFVFADHNIHESSQSRMDDVAIRYTDKLLDELDFMKDHVVCMLQGNHYWRFNDQTDLNLHTHTTTEYMAKKLNSTWGGTISYIRLRVKFAKTTKKVLIDILAAHGKAGGKLVGTPINQVDDLRRVFEDPDIYLCGHDHKRGGLPISRLEIIGKPGNLRVKAQRKWLARTGSFLKAYQDNLPSYVVGRYLSPADIGVIRFRADIKRTDNKGEGDIIHKDIHLWS